MRQHAIPQNILDVEFKIFTKFTLKEFAYLAMGIGAGGIFLFLYSKDQVPGAVAIPIFIISSGIGIVLALVPINDQPADQFIKNFVNAIRKPTRRVWLDSKMKQSRTESDAELAKEQVSKNLEDTIKQPKIIGSSKVSEKKTVTEDKHVDLLEELDSAEEKTEKKQTKTTASNTGSKTLTITAQNAGQYQFDIQGVERLPGNINVWLSDKNYKPISNAVVQLYDQSGNVLYANRTVENGYFLTNKIFNEGTYILKISNDKYTFPSVKIVLDNSFTKKPIKITAY